jgi:hypothetical protein
VPVGATHQLFLLTLSLSHSNGPNPSPIPWPIRSSPSPSICSPHHFFPLPAGSFCVASRHKAFRHFGALWVPRAFRASIRPSGPKDTTGPSRRSGPQWVCLVLRGSTGPMAYTALRALRALRAICGPSSPQWVHRTLRASTGPSDALRLFVNHSDSQWVRSALGASRGPWILPPDPPRVVNLPSQDT